MEQIGQFTVFWVFVSIGVGCGIFLIVSMVVGEVTDAVGHWFGGDGADHDVGGGADGMEMATPSFFSFKILLSFLTGFGVAGAIATSADQSVPLSIGWGVGAGFVMAALTYLFVNFLASQQASINVTDTSFIGKEGRIIVEIPEGGIGQVQVNTHAGSLSKLAKAVDGQFVAENSLVTIERLADQVALVKRLA